MSVTQMQSKRVERLADEVRAKILACRELIETADGEITIHVYRKGPGFEVKIGTRH